MFLFWISCLTSTFALLVSEWRGIEWGRWTFKIIAALSFIGLALYLGAWESSYGRMVLLALLLSFAGDVLLIADEKPALFLAGLVAFLLAHLVFAAAFAHLGMYWRYVGFAGPPVIILLSIVVRWLDSYVGGGMRFAVAAYIVVIGGMVCMSVGAWVHSPLIPTGAVLFAISDIAVARQRFVKPEMTNKLWGLPLYFIAQLLLASSVAG